MLKCVVVFIFFSVGHIQSRGATLLPPDCTSFHHCYTLSQSVIQIADPHPRSYTAHTHQQCFETAMASFCPQIQPPFSVDTPLIKMSLKGCFLFFNLRRTQKAKFVTVVKMVYLRRVCN